LGVAAPSSLLSITYNHARRTSRIPAWGQLYTSNDDLGKLCKVRKTSSSNCHRSTSSPHTDDRAGRSAPMPERLPPPHSSKLPQRRTLPHHGLWHHEGDPRTFRPTRPTMMKMRVMMLVRSTPIRGRSWKLVSTVAVNPSVGTGRLRTKPSHCAISAKAPPTQAG